MAGPSSRVTSPVYTVFPTLRYRDIAEVQANTPDNTLAHLARMMRKSLLVAIPLS